MYNTLYIFVIHIAIKVHLDVIITYFSFSQASPHT